MKKTFIITMFGSPFSWIDEYIENVQHLAEYGWEWKIFTLAPIHSKGNVEVIPMSTDEFNDLVELKLGVRPNMFMTEKGVPSVHVTDFYVFSGLIFEDYLKGSDWWGITNLDVVYGRLDHFVPDSLLENLDVWTDDINVVNGVFSLWRNIPKVNRLCLMLENWQGILSQAPCPKCMGMPNANQHSLYGSDEYGLTNVLKDPQVLKEVRYGYPKYYPIHSYDRLETQMPKIKLSIKEDGSLWELSEDTRPPVWEHSHRYFGREVGYYHFIVSKRWPNFYI